MFINYAHRGASHYAPQNTLSAFYLGLQMGANGIETDVQMTRDGVLVLYHDRELDTLTEGRGTILENTWADLQDLLVQGKEGANAVPDRIITLETFLRHFAYRDLTFAMEFKARDITAPVLEMIRAYGAHDKTIFSSFHREDHVALRELDPAARLGYLTDQYDENTLAFAHAIGAEQLCLKSDAVTPDSVALIHGEGFGVRAWSIRSEADMLKVINAGVDGGMTIDFPDMLTAYCEAHPEVQAR